MNLYFYLFINYLKTILYLLIHLDCYNEIRPYIPYEILRRK